MKGKLGKTGLLSLALVLALAVLGAGFAYWTENLHIYGTAETGHLDVEFSGASSSDPSGTNDTTLGGDWQTGFTINNQPENAGTTTLTHTADTATIAITNGYPCYAVWTQLDIKNTGTIPVKVQELSGADPVALGEAGVELVAWAITLDGTEIMSASSYPIAGFTASVPPELEGFFWTYWGVTPSQLEHYIFGGLVAALTQVQVSPDVTLDVHLLFHLTAEGVDYPTYESNGQYYPADIAENLPGYPGDISFSITATFTQWNAP